MKFEMFELQIKSASTILSSILQSPDFLTHILRQSDGKILSQVLVRESMILLEEIARQVEGGDPAVATKELSDSFFGSKIKIVNEPTTEAIPTAVPEKAS